MGAAGKGFVVDGGDGVEFGVGVETVGPSFFGSTPVRQWVPVIGQWVGGVWLVAAVLGVVEVGFFAFDLDLAASSAAE